MCLSSFKKYYLRLITILLIVYFFVSPDFDIGIGILITFLVIVGVVGVWIQCPKCGQMIGSTKGGLPYLPLRHVCPNCGQNTNVCKAEDDVATNRRLKNIQKK